MIERLNLTMLTDFYELTMANGYYESGMADDIACFDMFFRQVPDGGGYAIMAGLDQVISYLDNLEFTDEDIAYLEKKGIFSQEFLDYLREFRFTCDVWAIPEGTPIFPGEPLVTVKGPMIQAQFVETMILLLICAGTACTIADRDFGVPALGTMAHSWVQMYASEYEAFRKYAEIYPDNCVLLVDTYNVLKSGVPAAIRVFDEVKPKNKGIRIDSGDVAYLTKKARKMLDDAGHRDCKIVVSNSLDEYIIQDILLEGACIDSFGVGERLITSKSEPVFGGVYKLSALEKDGELIPKIKISENVGKITNPGFKTVYRLFDRDSHKAVADVITLDGEPVPEGDGYEIFDPQAVWKRKKLNNFYAKNLRVQIFDKGRRIYESPTIEEIRNDCSKQVAALWDETLRFENPQPYYVDLSKKLWEMKQELIEAHNQI